MTHITCTECKGRKKLNRLGYIEKNCETCKGIGYIEEIEISNPYEISSHPSTLLITDPQTPTPIVDLKSKLNKKLKRPLKPFIGDQM